MDSSSVTSSKKPHSDSFTQSLSFAQYLNASKSKESFEKTDWPSQNAKNFNLTKKLMVSPRIPSYIDS